MHGVIILLIITPCFLKNERKHVNQTIAINIAIEQGNQFIWVKPWTYINISSFRNENLTSIVFYVKDVNNSVFYY